MRWTLLTLTWFACVPAAARAQAEDLKNKPITTVPGKVGDLLRQWWKEGIAAGNVGDFYDNRDGGHSDLNTAPWPQLQRIVYSADDIKVRKHWAAQRSLLPHIVFGNSSTSAPPTAGGSNPRMYYLSPAGLNFLYQQYVSSNLYIYPEHRDHDPGHNGLYLPTGLMDGPATRSEGFGDLYPTNTPYLIISQGSSGSDQPFMRALPHVLAAFRPEVKKKLKEAGFLMPTIQMLLRSTNKHLKDPKDYLTGKAHPTVFEGSSVNELALVEAAHSITLDTIPPVVQLQVLEEDQPKPGRDFFDIIPTEKLADTPCVIARVWRGKEQKRRLVVSAQKTLDLNKKPLRFTWTVLRGDEKRIQITPKNDEQSVVEIIVSYHERRPSAPGLAMESNRVDIGVFAHNGHHYSAPGFVTFFSLDSEARTYDDRGRILEIGYGLTDTRLLSVNLGKLLDALAGEALALKLLPLDEKQRRQLLDARPKYAALAAQVSKAADTHRQLQTSWEAVNKVLKDSPKDDKLLARKKELEQEKAAADKVLKAAQQTLDDFAAKTGIDHVARRSFETLLTKTDLLKDDFATWQEVMPRGTLSSLQKQAASMGILRPALPQTPEWTLLQKTPTPFERAVIEQFNARCLEQAFAGMVTFSTTTNFVDQRLSAPKKMWRDLYRYDAAGKLLGWTRYHAAEPKQEFTSEGHLIVEQDAQGRWLKAHPVRYIQDPVKTFGVNNNPLRMIVEDMVIEAK